MPMTAQVARIFWQIKINKLLSVQSEMPSE